MLFFVCKLKEQLLTQQQLWRSVPQCDDPVGVAVPLAVFCQAEGPSQTEVGQLQDSVSGDQNVGCLHVSVENLSRDTRVREPGSDLGIGPVRGCQQV